jgi:arginyl-tRNA synthetase
MSLVATIKEAAVSSIDKKYGVVLTPNQITINQTKPEFEGDYTIVLFTLIKQLRKAPEALGAELGEYLTATHQTFLPASM